MSRNLTRTTFRLSAETIRALDEVADATGGTRVDALRLAASHLESVAGLANRISAVVGVRLDARACAEWVLHAAEEKLAESEDIPEGVANAIGRFEE